MAVKLWSRKQWTPGMVRVPLHAVFGGYKPQQVRGANMAAFIGRHHQWTYTKPHPQPEEQP